MRPTPFDRRVFLGALTALGLSTLTGCGGTGGGGATVDTTVAYRLSTKGRRASRAAKANAANKVFVSPAAARAGLAHPGDPSRVVGIDVSRATWMLFFGAGREAVDLRHV